MTREQVREALARYAHDEAWSGWMKYQFSKMHPEIIEHDLGTCGWSENGDNWVMPKEYVERWTRQMNTKFDDLPEAEKASDYKEADRILEILEELLK